MACINLLPWREDLRKERQREFITVLVGAAVLAGLVVLLFHIRVSGMIGYQNSRNHYLQQQITRIDGRIRKIKDLESTKTKLLARMEIIQRLQHSRPEVVHLFQEMVTTLPHGVYLKGIAQSGDGLKIQGVAQSNARVSEYMRRLDATRWLTDPRLDVIRTHASANGRVSDFTLQVGEAMPKNEGAGAAGAKRAGRRAGR
ncbi:fimbrial assembly protein (PilN) [bacterium BMS3Abin12]|nr:fimbrial assembly protein (PilN) [bacterium BMS3Abin12]